MKLRTKMKSQQDNNQGSCRDIEDTLKLCNPLLMSREIRTFHRNSRPTCAFDCLRVFFLRFSAPTLDSPKRLITNAQAMGKPPHGVGTSIVLSIAWNLRGKIERQSLAVEKAVRESASVVEEEHLWWCNPYLRHRGHAPYTLLARKLSRQL